VRVAGASAYEVPAYLTMNKAVEISKICFVMW